MDKPGGHRTGLNAHFGVDTSALRNTSRNWPGIGGADAAPEPLALLVDNADRGRLLRYVQPNIMRHRNLRWCKSPGNMPGSRHYRCLRLRTRDYPRSTDVAWIRGAGALSPTRVPGYAMRTYSGRPRSNIRFSTSTEMAMCGRPPRCKEKMEDQQLGQVRSCVRPRTMRYAQPRAMMNSTG